MTVDQMMRTEDLMRGVVMGTDMMNERTDTEQRYILSYLKVKRSRILALLMLEIGWAGVGGWMQFM